MWVVVCEELRAQPEKTDMENLAAPYPLDRAVPKLRMQIAHRLEDEAAEGVKRFTVHYESIPASLKMRVVDMHPT